MPQVLPGVAAPETSAERESAAVERSSAPRYDVINTLVSGGTNGTLSGLVAREAGRRWDDAGEALGLRERSPTLSAEEATSRYGIEGKLTFSDPVSEREALWRNAAKRDELFRQDILNRNDSVGPLEGFGVSLVGALVDPVTVPLNFIPAFGQGTLATRLGLGGVSASRGAAVARGVGFGALEGAAIGGLQEGAVFGLAGGREGRDYDLNDLMLGVTANAIFGGGARGALEGMGWRPPPVAQDAQARRIVEPGGRLEPGRLAAGDRVADLIRRTASDLGEDGETAVAIGLIESRLDPSARNPTSSAAGVFQFVDDTWAAMGGGDKMDAALNVRRGIVLLRQNRAALSRALGREPAPWELYLAHQQGAGGARSLLRDPERPAFDALRAAGLSERKARRAINDNGGDLSMTAGEFAGHWRRKFADTAGADVGPLRVDPVPEAVAMMGPEQRLGALARAVDDMAADQPVDVARLIDIELQRRPAFDLEEGVASRGAVDDQATFMVRPDAETARAENLGGDDLIFGWVEDGALRIERSNLQEGARGRGLGVAMYQRAAAEAEARGVTLASDFEVSADAQRVWASLERRGYEVERSPSARLGEDGMLATDDRSPVFTVAPGVRKAAAPVAAPGAQTISPEAFDRLGREIGEDAEAATDAILAKGPPVLDLRGGDASATADLRPAAQTLDQAATAEASFRRGETPEPPARVEPETPEAEMKRLADDVAALDDELDLEIEAGRLTEAEVEAARADPRDPKAVRTAIETAAACLLNGEG
jgi:GNAT superfamily N-acetyltransferase